MQQGGMALPLPRLNSHAVLMRVNTHNFQWQVTSSNTTYSGDCQTWRRLMAGANSPHPVGRGLLDSASHADFSCPR
jgi:hypothetical protein